VTLAEDQNPPGVAARALAAPTGLTVPAVSTDQISLTGRDHSRNETALAIGHQSGSSDGTRVGVVPLNTTIGTDTGRTPGAHRGTGPRAQSHRFLNGSCQ
jgi:hypothetical protein